MTWRKASWIPAEWAAEVESECGARTTGVTPDRRLKVPLGPAPVPLAQEDPIAAWRSERRAAAALARERSASPWGSRHGKSQAPSQPLETAGNDTGWEEDWGPGNSEGSPNRRLGATGATHLSLSNDGFGGLSTLSTVTGQEGGGALQTRHTGGGRSPSHAEYPRPWVPRPDVHLENKLTSTDLGRRQHASPRREEALPGARELQWDRQYKAAHTLLWGGGGNWQASVDAWEAQEAERQRAAAAVAREVIGHSQASVKRLAANPLGAGEGADSNSLAGGPSYASFSSQDHPGLPLGPVSEGDLTLLRASQQESGVQTLGSGSGSESGIVWAKVQPKFRWDVLRWSQGVEAQHPASRTAAACEAMKLQYRIPTHAHLHPGARAGRSAGGLLSGSSFAHAESAHGFDHHWHDSALVSQSHLVGAVGTSSVLSDVGSEGEYITGGSPSPMHASSLLASPLLSGHADMHTTQDSGGGGEAAGSRNAAHRLERSPTATAARTATANGPVHSPLGRYKYKPPAWELTESHSRRFQATALPLVNFQPQTTPSTHTTNAPPAMLDPPPIFPWIEQTITASESDPWAVCVYDKVGTAVDPSQPVPHVHPMPWRPHSPQRVPAPAPASLAYDPTDRSLTVRSKTAQALHGLRITLMLEEQEAAFAQTAAAAASTAPAASASRKSPLKSPSRSNRVVPFDQLGAARK